MLILRSVGPYVYRLTLENMCLLFKKIISITIWTDTLIIILDSFLLQPAVSILEAEIILKYL